MFFLWQPKLCDIIVKVQHWIKFWIWPWHPIYIYEYFRHNDGAGELIPEFQRNRLQRRRAPWKHFEEKRLASEVQLWNPDELFRPPPHVQQQHQQLQQQQQFLGSWLPWANHRNRGGRTRGRGGRRYGRGRGATGTRPYWARPAANRGHSGAQNNFNFY